MNMITVFYRRGRKCFAPLTRDDMRRELGRDPDEAGLPEAVKDGLVLPEALSTRNLPRVYELTPKGEAMARRMLGLEVAS